MGRNRRLGAVAAAVVLLAGLTACAPPSGGGGGGSSITTGCFPNSQGTAYIKISPISGLGYPWTPHNQSNCQDPPTAGAFEVYHTSTDEGAANWCRVIVGELYEGGPMSQPQFIGVFLNPAQPRVFRCSGGPA